MPTVLQGKWDWVPNRPCVDRVLAHRYRDGHSGLWGKFPRPLRLPLHPGDLLLPHLTHLHLRDLHQTYQGTPEAWNNTSSLQNIFGGVLGVYISDTKPSRLLFGPHSKSALEIFCDWLEVNIKWIESLTTIQAILRVLWHRLQIAVVIVLQSLYLFILYINLKPFVLLSRFSVSTHWNAVPSATAQEAMRRWRMSPLSWATAPYPRRWRSKASQTLHCCLWFSWLEHFSLLSTCASLRTVHSSQEGWGAKLTLNRNICQRPFLLLDRVRLSVFLLCSV